MCSTPKPHLNALALSLFLNKIYITNFDYFACIEKVVVEVFPQGQNKPLWSARLKVVQLNCEPSLEGPFRGGWHLSILGSRKESEELKTTSSSCGKMSSRETHGLATELFALHPQFHSSVWEMMLDKSSAGTEAPAGSAHTTPGIWKDPSQSKMPFGKKIFKTSKFFTNM